jgi:hypothetical protein
MPTRRHARYPAGLKLDPGDQAVLAGYSVSVDSRGYGKMLDPHRPGKQTYVHRVILGDPPETGLTVDHINGDKLDNRRKNLRWATHSLQQANRPTRGYSKTVVRGYTYWRATCKVDGRRTTTNHKTEAEARASYLRMFHSRRPGYTGVQEAI